MDLMAKLGWPARPTALMKSLPLAITLAFFSVAATPDPAPKDFNLAAINADFDQLIKTEGLVGISVAIVRNGEVVLAKGYGQRSLEPRQPVTTNTLFAIGSVTKQFTCACILLLAEDGKLSVQDKVAKYYPGLTRAD